MEHWAGQDRPDGALGRLVPRMPLHVLIVLLYAVTAFQPVATVRGSRDHWH